MRKLFMVQKSPCEVHDAPLHQVGKAPLFSPYSSREGFTLLEMAVVVAIIALLIGGMLMGSNLMRAAELHRVVQDSQRYVSAVHTFQDKYGNLPGDMSNATTIWGAAHAMAATCHVTASTGPETCDGDGNGRVEDASVGRTETFRFWQHLANAALIEGQYSGVAGPLGSSDGNPGENIPIGPIAGTGFHVRWVGYHGGNHIYFTGDYGHVLDFGLDTLDGLPNGNALLPSEAGQIDGKLDDGKPAYGKIRTYKPNQSPCATSTIESVAEYDAAGADIACALMFVEAF